MQLSPVLLFLCLMRYSLITRSREIFLIGPLPCSAHQADDAYWIGESIFSFPCCSIACLRPSLFHAVQTYSQRQNKFPHDNFCSTYSSKVKCYQTGIMLKILAKYKLQLQRQKSRKKQAKTVLQLCRSSARLQHSSSHLIQLLLLLLFPFLFTQILVSFSSPGVPKGTHIPLTEPSAPPGRDWVSCALCKGTTILGGGGSV